MSDNDQKGSSIVDRAAARIPPWPPRDASGDGDDSRPRAVLFYEERESADDAEPNRRLALVTFDPSRTRHTHETLSPRDMPPLFATISYFCDKGSFSIIVLQEGRLLATISTPGPADTYFTVRLSRDTLLSILIHRHMKV